MFQDQGNRKTLSIRRRQIFEDALKKISRCLTNGLCGLKIDFIGENENDFGGPTREFFSEFFQSTVGRLVHGREMDYCFLHDSVGTLKEHFESFGQTVALAIAHGCHGPRFFSKTLVGYLVNDQFKTDTSGMPDFDLKNKLEGIIGIKEEGEFKNRIKNFDERFQVGYNKVGIGEKQEFIDAVCRHTIIGNSHEEIYQFRKGLELGGIMELFRKFPEKAFLELTFEEKDVAADEIKKVIKVNHAHNFLS